VSKKYSEHFKRTVSSTTGESVVYLAEITHSSLNIPIRVANDTQDVYCQGNRFIACPFRVQFPDDLSRSQPRAPIAIDNIGRALTQWLEVSRGGRNATVKIMQIVRDNPDVIEQSYTLTLMNVKQNIMEVTGELGYENFMDMPCLAALYDPERAPGVF